MERFSAKHRQTRETISGSWDEVKDLDKRVWDIWRGELDDTPLCHLPVVDKDGKVRIKKIYDMTDLEGIYLG